MSSVVRELHGALLDLIGLINRPQQDDRLLAEAGVSLDRALFPLLVRIERRGPIGVIELADHAGRDHSTVSRQVAKLEKLGLVTRQPGRTDRRVNEAIVSARGKAMIEALDAARERLAGAVLAGWSQADQKQLAGLLRRFADALAATGPGNDLDRGASSGPPVENARGGNP